MPAVAVREHGRLVICNWSSGIPSLLSRIHRHRLGHLLHQHAGHHASLLLLNFRSSIRSETDGAVAILVWLVCGEDQ